MNAETIKDFLVSLGFQIDDAGARKFDAVVAGTTVKVVQLGSAVEAAALSVLVYTAKIASGLDQLYWSSQRTGATAAGIQAIGYAAAQAGSSAEAARGSLESLARFMRSSPGAEGFLNRLGVQTRDAKGNMLDMASIFTGVGDKLNQMPYYRANQYAQLLGIDENTLMAMRRGLGQFSGQYTQMAKAIGFNADQAAASSNRFMTSLRTFGQMAGMARDKIGSNLAEGLSGSIDTLRKQIVDNFPKIEGVITSGVKGLLWLAEVIGRVVYRLIQAGADIMDWWASLDNSTQQLIEIFGALVLAWRVLNSAFLMSPIGMITGLGLAILALYDDYKTWKEGGKSLIDWKKWEPEITGAIKAIDELKARIFALFDIDPQTWTAKWDLSNLTQNLGSLARMLDGIARLMSAIRDGRWSDAYAVGRELLQQNSNSDALPQVSDSANGAADWIKSKTGFDPRSIGEWTRNKFFKRPEPSKNGAALLGWLAPTLNNLEQMYRLPEGLLRSVAIAESSGDPNAMSGAGAQGLFQLMPGTAKDLGLHGNESFDPVKSAGAAAKYLSQLLKANGGDLSKALASYNWGIGNVQKHGMALMPEETRNYIPRVLSNMPSAGGAQISQETNINIYGVSDPGQAGKAVADQQTSVNSRFSQAMSTGPR
ncbi:transglycosylase SLT domain-containing protein [Pantoea agglomerans]|uniref:transglycosylase SLT domain-containing protein n=1 Tax=Enterobacter agglomerans TaxID=549 RepID=UPI001CCFFF9D|nr:transglycosylase SLT domain-containing protein [Pantoea agglomerans]UBN55311.1 transglycosylase SLT domain-containing protein [Pantoea agglomerans]